MKYFQNLYRLLVKDHTLTLQNARAHSTQTITKSDFISPAHTSTFKATKNQAQSKKAKSSPLTSKQDSMFTEKEFEDHKALRLKNITRRNIPAEEKQRLNEKVNKMTYSSWCQEELETVAWGDEHKKQQQKAKDLSSYGL